MKMNKIWMVACMAATLIGGVYGCDDDKDFSYEGQLDLNLLNLTQAREVWDGAECNVTTDLRQSEDETPVKNFTYKLSLSLYQGRTAGQEAKVSLVVNKLRWRKEAFMQNMTVRNYFRSPIIIYLLRH